MEEILHHLLSMKPYETWDIHHGWNLPYKTRGIIDGYKLFFLCFLVGAQWVRARGGCRETLFL